MKSIFKQFSAGYSRSMVVLDNDHAWAWGNVGRDQSQTADGGEYAAICGTGPLEIGHHRFAQPLPQLLNPHAPVCYLSEANTGFLALTPKGEAEFLSAITVGSSGSDIVQVVGLPGGLRQIISNESASYALDDSGHVWSWGNNFQGQLGRRSDSVLNQRPAKIGLPSAVSLATGRNHTLALTRNGEVWAWGGNGAGQLGQGHLVAATQPVRVMIDAPIRSIAAGDTHSLAIDHRGRLYAWGSNNFGQLGPIKSRKNNAWLGKPVQISLDFGLKQIDAGMHFTVALTDQHEVYAWGWNGLGQLSDHEVPSSGRPLKVKGLSSVDKISVGPSHTLALDLNGLYAWGDNRNAACGILPGQHAVVKTPNHIAFS